MQSNEAVDRLILPANLDKDIKRRLTVDGIASFLETITLTSDKEIELINWYKAFLPGRLSSGWTNLEINYLLYGRQTPTGLVCTGYHFQYYNFFHYIDFDDPEQAIRQDICDADPLAPHTHSYLNNLDRNPNRGRKFLGSLHSHPLLGFLSRKKMNSVTSVGFSPDDEWWNNRYLTKYGADGRNMAFVIYYADNDFYKGITLSQSTQPQHLDILVQ